MHTSTSRKVKAIWNILTQRGYKTHVLGWFAGHPAEPINGISVSDLFPYAVGPLDKEWPLPPGAVHPENMRDTFAALRHWPHAAGLRIGFHEAEDAVLVRPFARRDGVPQQWRKNRTQSRQVPHDALVDEIIQGRHEPLVKQRINKFPVGSIPADQENFLARGLLMKACADGSVRRKEAQCTTHAAKS